MHSSSNKNYEKLIKWNVPHDYIVFSTQLLFRAYHLFHCSFTLFFVVIVNLTWEQKICSLFHSTDRNFCLRVQNYQRKIYLTTYIFCSIYANHGISFRFSWVTLHTHKFWVAFSLALFQNSDESPTVQIKTEASSRSMNELRVLLGYSSFCIQNSWMDVLSIGHARNLYWGRFLFSWASNSH